MKQAMKELCTPLSEEEMEWLDRFLLDRFDDDIDTEDKDEGILDISTLDGLFTAIVSGPELIHPSKWLPLVWGDFEPVWGKGQELEDIFSLMVRHMNGISTTLMEQPEIFEPIFMQREVEGKIYTIVDDWCEGYIRGVELLADQWHLTGKEMFPMLFPILAFTSTTNWQAHEMDTDELETTQQTITPSVREIHAYWLAQREEFAPGSETVYRDNAKIGRNNPCPCGSGKKYKKCCLKKEKKLTFH